MRRASLLLAVCVLAFPVWSQQRRPVERRGPSPATSVEIALRNAIEQFAGRKKMYERDFKVLEHLQRADEILTDPMQPATAIQRSWEQVREAERLEPEFLVMQGVIRARQELESARRSPSSSDFGRLRATLQSEAIGPSRRLVARNALALEEETLEWLRAQEAISRHLREMAELAAESLRRSQL
jgi:hypothetical protein